MRFSRLITGSLALYWRTGVTVALGVAVATAVITGSLLVGDSVTGSVSDTVLGRLGDISYALTSPTFFRDGLAHAVAGSPEAGGDLRRVSAAVITRGAVRNLRSDAVVPSIGIVGVDDDFWELFPGHHRRLSGRQVAMNQALAQDLGAKAGDSVLVSFAREGTAPTDTLFARRDREDVLGSMRLEVAHILPDTGVGAFALSAQTFLPRNVFVSKEWLARELRKEGRANVLLVQSSAEARIDRALSSALASACTAADYGIRLAPNEQRGYLSVESEKLVLTNDQVDAAAAAAAKLGARAAATSVYLADSIRKPGGPTVAYAVIASVEQLEPFVMKQGSAEFENDGMLLNSWAAEDLGANVGDELELEYLVPSFDGVYRAQTRALILRGIVELEGPAADHGLVPSFEGITDAETVDDWEPPFPVDLDRVTDRDDEYWRLYRAAPKAYVSPRIMRSIWRGGIPQADESWVTSVRVMPPGGMEPAGFAREFSERLKEELSPHEAGLAFGPVRRQALEASRGTQDYGMLFVSMSVFLVLAGMGLAGMLMRLSVHRRAAEAGTLLACGFTNRAVMGWVMGEGALLTLAGVGVGVPLGIAYAGGIIHLLTGWFGSIGNAPLWLHVKAGSLAAGGLGGLGAGLGSVWWGTRSIGRSKVLDLLAGWQAMNVVPAARHRRLARTVLVASVVVAAVLVGAVRGTGVFFASGAVLLLAGLCASYLWLAAAVHGRGRVSMTRLGVRSAGANRGRSMLVVGLLACASFVIVAVAAHTRDYSRVDVARLDSGTGGFSLHAISSMPIHYDFGTKSGREKLGFPPEDELLFTDVAVFSFLASSGDDISCLNLAKPMFPRVLGVGQRMIDRGGFRVATVNSGPGDNPWRTLLRRSKGESVPVFGDADSVRWQLHSGLGKTVEFPAADARPVELQVTGTIAGSIFAGELLMSEGNFRTTFPVEEAPRYFLIETPAGIEDQVAAALRRNLGDLSLEVRSTREILNAVIGVQNTYISTFEALGGLGVVLGTVGLVIVVLRGALERRGEFALMLASGFSRTFLAAMLILEHSALLFAGLACGTISALIAVAPQIGSSESEVNWRALAGLLAGVIVTGLVSCGAAAASAVRGNLIQALREE